MAVITYRLVKGSEINAAEYDGSFHALDDRVTVLETTPPVAVSIDHFVVSGTLLTIYLTNGTHHGPFVLPQAQWRWTGEYDTSGVTYLPGDIFTEEGDVYFTRVQHVSVDPFDPAAFSVDGFLYIKILAKQLQPYDIGLFYNDTIPSGVEVIMLHAAVRTFTLPVNFLGSACYLMTATSSIAINLPVYKNGNLIGFVTFTPGVTLDGLGGQHGTFSTVDTVDGTPIVAGDILAIALPYEEDTTARGLAVTLATLTAGV